MKKYRSALSAVEVRTALDYDPETGVFLWRSRADREKNWNTRRAGKVAGYLQKFHHDNEYLVIRLEGVLYLAHRLAWLHMHGAWPDRDLDHIDRDTRNNRIANLRLVTHAENHFNRTKQRNNKSGHKGIHKHGLKWRAQIAAHGQKLMESFYELEDAIEWHRKMTIMLHGEFAPKK